MKIMREGKEYELTSDELFNAYLEQEHIFDIQNIENNMEYHLRREEYEILKDNRDFIERAADELRHNQDKHDMDYEYALSEAFRDIKDEFFEKNTKKSYFEISVTYGPHDGDGYSVFVELDGPASEQDAVDKAVNDCLFHEPEDAGNIDFVEEIGEDVYLQCTGRKTESLSLDEKMVTAGAKVSSSIGKNSKGLEKDRS